MLLLKYLARLEQDEATEAEFEGKKYTYIIVLPYRWDTWAAPKDTSGKLDHNKALTGRQLSGDPGYRRCLFGQAQRTPPPQPPNDTGMLVAIWCGIGVRLGVAARVVYCEMRAGALNRKNAYDRGRQVMFGQRLRSVRFSQLMQRLQSAWLALTLLAILSAMPSHAAISAGERAALAALYQSTQGPTWANTSNLWTVAGAPGNECTWFGVVCTAAGNGDVVTELNLGSNNLAGSLPAGLSGLQSLQYLRLRGNQLIGSAAVLGSLSQLRFVDIGANQFSGSLPPLGSLPALQVFAAPGNLFNGQIPVLAGLTNLQVLWLSGNDLRGPIPSLAGLSALQMFYVDNNLLTGTVPSLSGLASLQSFYAGSNRLTGSVAPFAGVTALRHYRVENNQLTGALPALTALGALEVFYVSGNQVSGPVPVAPASAALVAEMSALCPNQLTPSSDSVWDAATPGATWSAGCTAALPQQVLTFGPVPTLVTGGAGVVSATSNPSPGSVAPIIYSSLTPGVCTVNSSSGLATVLPAAPMGSVCTIAANKAGDATINSAVQVAQAIKISALCRLDVNDDGQRTPGIDGVLIARYLAGMRGAALLNGLTPLAGTRTTSADIENFLAAQDFDARGISPSSPQVTRDGVMIARYLQGLAPTALVASTDVVSADAAAINARLQSWCTP